MTSGLPVKRIPSPTAPRNSAAVAPVRCAKLSASVSVTSIASSTPSPFISRRDFNACGAALRTSRLCLTDRCATSTAIPNSRPADRSSPNAATSRGASRKVFSATAGESMICLAQSETSTARNEAGKISSVSIE